MRAKYGDAQEYRHERPERDAFDTHGTAEQYGKERVAQKEDGVGNIAGPRVAIDIDHLLQHVVYRDEEREPDEPGVESVDEAEEVCAYGGTVQQNPAYDGEHPRQDKPACKGKDYSLPEKLVGALLLHFTDFKGIADEGADHDNGAHEEYN